MWANVVKCHPLKLFLYDRHEEFCILLLTMLQLVEYHGRV